MQKYRLHVMPRECQKKSLLRLEKFVIFRNAQEQKSSIKSLHETKVKLFLPRDATLHTHGARGCLL